MNTDAKSNEQGLCISVVTICMNAESHIRQTIESVLSQSYPRIEFIVVDGGSTDRTLDIVREYESRITKYISEPDKGISDAMNKGVGLATGEFVLFLHADDYFLSEDAVEKAVEQLDADHDVFGFSLCFESESSRRLLGSKDFDWRMNFKMAVRHQATFCRRGLFKQIGGFDTSLRIAMDYDFFLKAYRQGVKAKAHPAAISVMRDTGVSSMQDWKSRKLRFDEYRTIHFRYCHDWISWTIYWTYWTLYIPYRMLRQLTAASIRPFS